MLRQWDTGEALRADGAAAVPHVPPQYRRRFPHIARWSVAAATPDAVIAAKHILTRSRDEPIWSGLLSGHENSVVHPGAPPRHIQPLNPPPLNTLGRGGCESWLRMKSTAG